MFYVLVGHFYFTYGIALCPEELDGTAALKKSEEEAEECKTAGIEKDEKIDMADSMTGVADSV